MIATTAPGNSEASQRLRTIGVNLEKMLLPREMSEVFLLKSGTEQSCLASLLLLNIVLPVLASVVWKDKEINIIRNVKKEIKLSHS